jgi:hypothetical protein
LTFGVARFDLTNPALLTCRCVGQMLSLTIEVLRRRCYIPSALTPGCNQQQIKRQNTGLTRNAFGLGPHSASCGGF